MNVLKAWLKGRTRPERERLAAEAKTSAEYLRLVSMGHRNASAEIAAAVEEASMRMGAPLRRGDVCKVCNECPYFNRVAEESLV